MEIIKRKDNLGDHEFWFDNDSWVRVNQSEECYEFQSDPNDGETYFEGMLEFSEDGNTLEGFDGCYELPKEVVIACRELGLAISEYIDMDEFSPEFREIENDSKTNLTKGDNTMETKNVNETMNQVIVRLNELKDVKMSNITKSKRQAAKFSKEVATYLLDNWSDLAQLKLCRDTMAKDMPDGADEVMSLYDGRIKELEPKTKEKAKKDIKKQEKKQEAKKPAEKKAKTDSDTAAKRGRKSKHYVGELHPNGPWLWTDLGNGKFDWKSKNGKWWKGRTDIPEPTDKPAQEQKPRSKAGKTTTTQEDKKEVEPQDIVAFIKAKTLPKKGLSKPQEAAWKAIRKGMKVKKDGNALWLTDGETNMRVEKGVLTALERRLQVDFSKTNLYIE